jgi:hypothetical protein
VCVCVCVCVCVFVCSKLKHDTYHAPCNRMGQRTQETELDAYPVNWLQVHFKKALSIERDDVSPLVGRKPFVRLDGWMWGVIARKQCVPLMNTTLM